MMRQGNTSNNANAHMQPHSANLQCQPLPPDGPCQPVSDCATPMQLLASPHGCFSSPLVKYKRIDPLGNTNGEGLVAACGQAPDWSNFILSGLLSKARVLWIWQQGINKIYPFPIFVLWMVYVERVPTGFPPAVQPYANHELT